MYQRAKFINDILSINSPSKNVQLEIIYTILYDTVRNDEMKYKKFVFLHQQPSWLLQNSSYGIAGEMTKPPVELLIKEYSSNAEDYKKLLIMDVLLNNITDTVFTFLASEYASSKDERIKEMIGLRLAGAQNEELAYQWYAGHYDLVEKYIQAFIGALFYHDGNIYCRIVSLALEKGWKPSSFTVGENEWAEGKPVLYKELYDAKTEDYQDDTSRVKLLARVKIIEDALLNNPGLKNEWQSFQAWAKGITLPGELIKKHEELTRLYLEQTDKLFLQYKVDTSHTGGFKKEIITQAGNLQSLKYRQ